MSLFVCNIIIIIIIVKFIFSLNIPLSSPPRLIKSPTFNHLKGLVINRPYPDTQYYSGTSVHLRLMQGVFSNASCIN